MKTFTNCSFCTGALISISVAVLSVQQSAAQNAGNYSWSVVDSYQYVPGQSAVPNAVALDVSGNILVAGYGLSNATSKTTVRHALVRGALNSGGGWNLLSDFVYSPGKNSTFFGIASDPSGNIYPAGQCSDSTGASHWITRRGSNGGQTWQTIDDYKGPAGSGAGADGIFADSSGRLYAAGWGDAIGPSSHGGKTTIVAHWIIRSAPDGVSWSTIDDFQLLSSANANAYAVASNGVSFFAVGAAFDQAGTEHWIVRRSATGATGTWATVDDFASGEPRTVGVGIDGAVYVGGNSGGAWTVRSSADNGLSWTTVDLLTQPCDTSWALGFATDAFGNINCIGQNAITSGTQCNVYWTIRTSATGDAGSWVTTDEFQPNSPLGASGKALVQGANGVLFSVGSTASSSGQFWLVQQGLP